MLKRILFIYCLLVIYNLKAQINYPSTKKIPVINTYHGVDITDNYQWLENFSSPEVTEWVSQQNKVTLKYLDKQVHTNGAKADMKSFLWSEMEYNNYVENKKNQEYYFRLMYPSKNAQANIYYKKGNKTSYQQLITPNAISTKDRIIFTNLAPSPDDHFLAYQYNRNGSDWGEIKIVGIKKRHYFKEVLTEVIAPQINWYGQGFFYVKNTYNAAKVSRSFPELKYHILGTEQSTDAKIFNVDTKDETLSLYGVVKQSLYILKKADNSKDNYSYYYLRPQQDIKTFTPFFTDINYDIQVHHFENDTVFATTDIRHKKYVISFPINEPKKWALLTPSYKDAVFTDAVFADKKIVTSFQLEKSSLLTVTDFKGSVLGEVITPEGLAVSGLYFDEEKKELTFNLSSYTIPSVSCKLDLNMYKFTYLGQKSVAFDSSKYKFTRTTFTSHDGVQIPIFIVYKDSLSKNGTTPFLLNTYGGYGSIAQPNFKPGVVSFIENGGAFAYVHIRGGGEFGYNWWQEGRNLKKRNGILDFTKAADFLIAEGYTKPKKIAIMGTSHGGLVAAAALMERPELFGAAVINVGALDMLRIENTETGAHFTNISEYGTVKNEEEFKNLLSYSPFHTIKENVNYPATLIITGTNDSRVLPYQSYKFAAKLQNRQLQTNPILLWTQEKEGHYGASQYNSIIEELTYEYTFLSRELNKAE
ncbi:prolyl oligopeptidase family serine peptidase [uncultured Polaribacter sp.]|uniref:prolyl oligopeptidase family serine peptidase n=1 Tax=uncultured Polaribacter sp. TaxID=174711 RepID=UPI0030D79632|tara:strand:- start:21955 stop:24054 length:2100 start_codon:yes stop_codon:yes gene_type:complete